MGNIRFWGLLLMFRLLKFLFSQAATNKDFQNNRDTRKDIFLLDSEYFYI